MTVTRVDHAALFAILSSLADNKQTLGRRYAFWCNGAPALEAAVAAAAMAQDELGHARALYPLLDHFSQAEADPRQIEPLTRTLRYHLGFLDEEFQGWTDFVATNFLFDTALTTFFAAAETSSYEPLRQRACKIVQEERSHEIHGVGWVRRLARAGGAVNLALTASLQRIWNETLCWFGPADDPHMRQLLAEGIVAAGPDELRDRYLEKIMPTLRSLEIPPASANHWATGPLSWDSWDATERRFR